MDVEAQTKNLANLRAQVARLEGRAHEIATDNAGATWRLGVAAIDAATDGLQHDGLHVFRPAGVGDTNAGRGLLFALAAVAGLGSGHLLWVTTAAEVRERGRPYGPALARAGIEPEQLLVIEARRPVEAAWAVEEAVKSRTFTAVLATGLPLDFRLSRRLAVASVNHHCPCLAIDAPLNASPLAAATLWRVAVRPSLPDPYDPAAPGAPAWTIELLRKRGGRPAGPWDVVWHEAAHRFALAPATADRSIAAIAPARRCPAESPGAERGRAARA